MARSTTLPDFRPTVRCWTDPPSVILGRFQRTSDEVDTGLCEQLGIELARRFTGGGAVFHDEGNLNVTLVNRRSRGTTPSVLHETMCEFILHAVAELGLKGMFLSPNSILIGGKKVSGSAAALGAGFQLWHSSTIVASNLDVLERVLGPSKKTDSTGFIRSRWQPVTSLRVALGSEISLDRVESQFMRSIQRILHVELSEGGLTAGEETLLTRLGTRYASRDWNRYGRYEEE